MHTASEDTLTQALATAATKLAWISQPGLVQLREQMARDPGLAENQ